MKSKIENFFLDHEFFGFLALAAVVLVTISACCVIAFYIMINGSANLSASNPFAFEAVLIFGFLIWFGLIFIIGFPCVIISDAIEDRRDRKN